MSPVKRIQTVQMACLVVETIARLQPVGVTEIARVAKLDASGVQRLLETLHEAGWIHPNSSKQTRWQLSAKLIDFARHVPAVQLIEGAPAVMEKLRDETNETVLLEALEGSDLVVVRGVESPHPVRISGIAGGRYPINGTAGGRSILAHLPLDMAQRLTGSVDRAALVEEMEAVHQHGFAVLDQTRFQGTIGVGCAIFDEEGVPFGALVITAPSFRANDELVQAWGALVAKGAGELSAKPPAPQQRPVRRAARASKKSSEAEQ